MKNLALMGAIALTGAVGFTACSSSNDVAEDINPNYNPETNAVKTEFVINVTQPGERTRMAADDAGAGAFQGINNMKLLCYQGTPGSTGNNTVTTGATGNTLELTSYNTPTPDGNNTNGSSKVYTLYIPNGTTNFLFYATAKQSVADQFRFNYGKLRNNLSSATMVTTANPTSETTEIKFKLEPIVSTETTVTAPQALLLNVLNGIVGASYDKGTPADANDDISWASTTEKTESQWRALKTAFLQFTNQANNGDVRQGSSDAILNMVSDLFDAVHEVYANESDTDANGLAQAILSKIAEFFNVTVSGTTYSWTSRSYKTSDYINFPEKVNLPSGAAVIVYNTSSRLFSFVNNGTSGTAAVSTAYDNFTYPSELTYYCNSGLWQSTTAKSATSTTDYPQTSATWLSKNWINDGWTSSAVTAATRAVAMKDNITYGAAQLVSTIKLDDGVGTTTPLTDNKSTITGGAFDNNVFDGSNSDKTIVLKVHGILIGGQPASSRYDYLPTLNDVSKVIYDRFNSEGTVVTEGGVTNYTLAMDNFVSGENATQGTVNVALEMTADKEFYGLSGKIKPGQKFYLIGELNPSQAAANAIDWTKHVSFKSTDDGYDKNRVFIRDAKTTATFTLKGNTLKNAYSTIPDLRSTQMLFGISVDLAWKAGLTFDVPIGN